jgi:hypothetical protein
LGSELIGSVRNNFRRQRRRLSESFIDVALVFRKTGD